MGQTALDQRIELRRLKQRPPLTWNIETFDEALRLILRRGRRTGLRRQLAGTHEPRGLRRLRRLEIRADGAGTQDPRTGGDTSDAPLPLHVSFFTPCPV